MVLRGVAKTIPEDPTDIPPAAFPSPDNLGTEGRQHGPWSLEPLKQSSDLRPLCPPTTTTTHALQGPSEVPEE